MAGRGAQSFKKRQKEQQRKEKQQEKLAKRLERKQQGPNSNDEVEDMQPLDRPQLPPEFYSEHQSDRS